MYGLFSCIRRLRGNNLINPSMVLVVSLHHIHKTYCDAQTSVPTVHISQYYHVPVHFTPNQKHTSLIVDLKSVWRKFFKSIGDLYAMISRFSFLMYTLTPVIVLSPITLCFKNNNEIQSYWWKVLLSSLSRSGPCLTKFSQWVATRPDLFPLSLCNHLKQLQIETNSHNQIEAVKMIKSKGWDIQIIQTENGTNQAVVLGSGCVAQVIKGSIMREGVPTPVAIKVIQSDVKSSITTDLNIMRLCCSWMEMIPGVKVFSLSESIEEFANLMTMQLDLTKEAQNLRKFRENFSKKRTLLDKLKEFIFEDTTDACTFPEPIFPYISSDVMVETFEDGIIMGEMMMSKDDIVKKKLARIGLNAILKMVFEDNFTHADLHPGNIIVKRVGDNYQLCLIDAGIVAELDAEDRRNFIDVFHGIVTNNGYRVGELFVERSKARSPFVNKEGFANDMADIINEVHKSGLPLQKIGIGLLLQKVLVSCYSHQVKLEPKFSSILIAIGVLEGLGRSLDENVDILRSSIPYVLQAALQQSKID